MEAVPSAQRQVSPDKHTRCGAALWQLHLSNLTLSKDRNKETSCKDDVCSFNLLLMGQYKAHTPVVAQVSDCSTSVSYVVLKRNRLLLCFSIFPLHYSLLPPSPHYILSGRQQETPKVWSEDVRAHVVYM